MPANIKGQYTHDANELWTLNGIVKNANGNFTGNNMLRYIEEASQYRPAEVANNSLTQEDYHRIARERGLYTEDQAQNRYKAGTAWNTFWNNAYNFDEYDAGIAQQSGGASTWAGAGMNKGENTNITGTSDSFDRMAGYTKGPDGLLRTSDNAAPWKQKNFFNRAGYSLEYAMRSIGLTYDRLLSRVVNIGSVNKNKVSNSNDYTHFGRSYVFFTKPDLFLYTDRGEINPSIRYNCPDLYAKIVRNPHVARSLQTFYDHSPVISSGAGFLHLLGNMCTSVTAPSLQLSTKEAAKNIKGYGINYGGDFMESLKENEVSIQFLDNRFRDVSTLMEIWTEYIEGVSQGKIYKKQHYRDGNILDYAVTMYILIIGETNNIIAHSAMVGMFPKSLSTEILNHSRETKDANVFVGPFSYEFQVSHFLKPNSHSIVEMFNYASGFTDLREYSYIKRGEKATYGIDYAQSYYAEFRNIKSKSNTRYIMHHSIEPWGTDIIRRNGDKLFERQFNFTEYYPQTAGITLGPTDAAVSMYYLNFYSKEEYLHADGHTDFENIVKGVHTQLKIDGLSIHDYSYIFNLKYWMNMNHDPHILRRDMNEFTTGPLFGHDDESKKDMYLNLDKPDYDTKKAKPTPVPPAQQKPEPNPKPAKPKSTAPAKAKTPKSKTSSAPKPKSNTGQSPGSAHTSSRPEASRSLL